MSLPKRSICALLCAAVLLLAAVPLDGYAAQTEDTKPYIQKMLLYCSQYQQEAATDILAQLDQIRQIDPDQGKAWERILNAWDWVNHEMEVNWDVLPDGLPQDDSLCIAVMGYNLLYGGIIRPELKGRLEATLRSAEKYPNAMIACSGGPSSGQPDITEAGVMAQWLIDHGIEESRIILEEKASSTVENAMFTYEILNRDYPQVQCVAIITSDFHVRRSSLVFEAVSIYKAAYEGGREIPVVGNAIASSNSGGSETVYFQAWGLAVLADVRFEGLSAPNISKLMSLSVTPKLTVTAHYTSGLSRDVTALAEISGLDPSIKGIQQVTVRYTENDITKTAQISVAALPTPVSQTGSPAGQPDVFTDFFTYE